MDGGITVELVAPPSESDGWAVVYRKAGMPRKIIAVYLTRAQAEAAAERLTEEAAKNA